MNTPSVSDNPRPDYYKVEVMAWTGEKRQPVTLECFDLIDALGFDFYTVNVMKYLFRAGKKRGTARADDLKKAIVYLRQAAERS